MSVTWLLQGVAAGSVYDYDGGTNSQFFTQFKGQGPGLVNVLFGQNPSNSFTRLDIRTMTSASVAAFGVIILCSVLTRVHLTQARHAPDGSSDASRSTGRTSRKAGRPCHFPPPWTYCSRKYALER